MQKHWVKIVAGSRRLFILVDLLVPFLVNADTSAPRLKPSSPLRSAASHPRPSQLLPLQRQPRRQDISIADDPAFSTSPFLQAKSLHIGVEVLPLIFHRQVRITNLTVDSPSINLLHAANGRWNFSSIGGALPVSQSPQQVERHSRPHRGRIENQRRQRLRLLHPCRRANPSSIPASTSPSSNSLS